MSGKCNQWPNVEMKVNLGEMERENTNLIHIGLVEWMQMH